MYILCFRLSILISLVLQVKQRVAEWRNTFGATALAVVSKAFQDEDEFNSADAVATRIRYLLAGKYPPWLWGNAFVPPMAGTVRRISLCT
jgi:ABC-type cobalt transport system substrate-binding protein